MNAVVIFAILSVLLIAGKILRVQIPLLQKLYLPSSVVGGILGLVLLTVFPNAVPGDIVREMRLMPGFLINVIFATLFLGAATPKVRDVVRLALPQLALGQIIAWGQYVVGLGLAGFLFVRLFGVPAACIWISDMEDSPDLSENSPYMIEARRHQEKQLRRSIMYAHRESNPNNLTADDLDMTGWEEADRKRKAGDDAAMRAFCETVWRISNEKKLKR